MTLPTLQYSGLFGRTTVSRLHAESMASGYVVEMMSRVGLFASSRPAIDSSPRMLTRIGEVAADAGDEGTAAKAREVASKPPARMVRVGALTRPKVLVGRSEGP